MVVRAVVFAACMLAAQPALAGFGASSWGMSPEAAVDAAKKAGETVTSNACPVPWAVEPHQLLVHTSTNVDGIKLDHNYVFGKDAGLELVVTYVMGTDSARACELQKQRYTAAFGQPQAGDPAKPDSQFDLLWQSADQSDVVGLKQGTSECQVMYASRAYAANGGKLNQSGLSCFEPVKLGDNRGHLERGSGTCELKDDSFVAMRPLRIETATDLQFELAIDKPGRLAIGDARGGKNLAEEVTSTAPSPVDTVARARLTLQPGCYLVGVASDGKQTATYYSLDVETYAAWKENDDLRREEQLGEPGDPGPPTARYPAIFMGTPPYAGERVHLHATGTIALASSRNLYGASASLGVELTRHRRARPIVGATLSVMVQPMGDEFATTNTMLPVGLWGGVRANLAGKLLGVARAGLLGYYISADTDEQMLGAIDRSETGSGYLLGLDLEIASFTVGAEWWLLGETVTTLHLGFGF